MEREGTRANFVKRNRLNIVASSVAAISIATGAAIEKPGSFDPLTDSVDSANHLILNTPHKAYEQLIDKLPETEKAEAGVPDIFVGQKDIIILQETGSTQDDIEYIRAVIVNLVNDSTTFTAYVNESSVNTIIVNVYRYNTVVLGGNACVWPRCGSGNNFVRIDLADNEVISSYLSEDFSADDKQTIYFSRDKWVLAHEFGHLNGAPDPQTKENAVLNEIGAGWSRVNYRRATCLANGDKVSDFNVNGHPGFLDGTKWNNARIAAGGLVDTDECGGSVGAIADAPDLDKLNENLDTKNKDKTLPTAARVALASTIAAATATAAAFYINRHRSS